MVGRSNNTKMRRRSFLSSLITLPLLGGSLELVGDAARPDLKTNAAMLERYQALLCRESLATLAEIQIIRGVAPAGFDLARFESYQLRVPGGLVLSDVEAETIVASAPPSTRAAVVMAAVGMRLVI